MTPETLLRVADMVRRVETAKGKVLFLFHTGNDVDDVLVILRAYVSRCPKDERFLAIVDNILVMTYTQMFIEDKLNQLDATLAALKLAQIVPHDIHKVVPDRLRAYLRERPEYTL